MKIIEEEEGIKRILKKLLTVHSDGRVRIYARTSSSDLSQELNEDPNSFLATNRLPQSKYKSISTNLNHQNNFLI